MLSELIVATVMVLVTVLIHGIGLILLSQMLRIEAQEESVEGIHPLSVRAIGFTMAIVLGLFVLHGTEIWLYALVYTGVGAVPDTRAAVYLSTLSYGTLGYSEEAISPEWHLVSAIEGLNGIILLGWSTAFFVTVVGRMGRRR